MSKNPYMIGQRWVSETEAELGLGIVLDISNRRLTLSFPATGERRTYAMENAPVSRVRYQVGESVRDQEGRKIKIREVLEQNACLAYRGATAHGEELLIPEFELDSFVQFSTPRERLFSGQIDRHQYFTLRHQTLEHLHRHARSAVYGLAGPRVQLLPHQLYIAREVANRYAPRVLLADEVGLGKTIEAGLILHQQLISGQASRALVVVPASLQHQWLVEMLRRFNLSFTLLDEARCQAMLGLDDIDLSLLPEGEDIIIDEADDNPFESAQLVLCSLDFLVNHPRRYEQALAAEWDLLLVDEAHHLQWQPERASPEYTCIDGLSKIAKGLLLLTATPEQLGLSSHFARLRLLDPDRYHDLDAFIAEQQDYQQLNDLVQALLQARSPEAGEIPGVLIDRLTSYLPESTLAQLHSQAADDSVAQALDHAVDLLLDRHGTGRVLFRNTRASVSGFPERQLHTWPLPLDEVSAQSLSMQPLAVQLCPENFWQTDDQDWWLRDPRVEWLAQWLRENRGRKVLVICASADTAQSLELYLRLRKGLASAVFHEDLSLIERDRAAAYFADAEEGAQLLICSEIGSEGRNFQFAQDLVLFDLPWNPDLLEQRIGRLDRIGQTGRVNIHVPFYPGSAQSRLLDWYHQGLNAFEKTCAIGQTLFSELGEPLAYALTASDISAFTQLLAQTSERAQALIAQLQAGRDRLLELNSCKPAPAQALVTALQSLDESQQLPAYMERVFDCFGIDYEAHSEHSWALHPSDHMRVDHLPGLDEDGMTVTWLRERALSRDDMHYLTWEHPLVRGSQELIARSEFGNTAVCTLKLPPLKPGTLLLEALFVLHCSAPPALQISRHLPAASLRILLDTNGKDLSGALEIGKLSQLLQKVARPAAQELVRHARPELSEMIKQAEQKILPREAELVAEAKASLARELGHERARLEALAQVNPNVRLAEIEYLAERERISTEYLSQTKLRLDAVRVIMTV